MAGRKKTAPAAEEAISESAVTETAASETKDETPKKRGRKTAANTESAAADKGCKNCAASEDESSVLTYDKIVETVKSKAASAKPALDFAAQITLTGEFTGVNPNGGKDLFIKCTDGKADVQPYEYNDADIKAEADADALLNMTAGKLTLYDAVEQGKVSMNKLNTVTIALKNIIS